MTVVFSQYYFLLLDFIVFNFHVCVKDQNRFKLIKCLKIAMSFVCSGRSGQMRVLSLRVAVVLMCNAHYEDKYRCKFLSLPASNKL